VCDVLVHVHVCEQIFSITAIAIIFKLGG